MLLLEFRGVGLLVDELEAIDRSRAPGTPRRRSPRPRSSRRAGVRQIGKWCWHSVQTCRLRAASFLKSIASQLGHLTQRPPGMSFFLRKRFQAMSNPPSASCRSAERIALIASALHLPCRRPPSPRRARSRPRRRQATAVSGPMPPSISISPSKPMSRRAAHLRQHLRHEGLAAEAREDAHDEDHVEITEPAIERRASVSGLRTMPTCLPLPRIILMTSVGSSSASMWKVTMSAPASQKGSTY